MQPYFFPYLGYFQLINATDTFVFLDDVNYITGGWINRNKILIQGVEKYITIPCRKASQNKLILEVEHKLNGENREYLLRKVQMAYKGAPFFEKIFPIFKEVMYSDLKYISDLALMSIRNVLRYLKIDRTLKVSSKTFDKRKLKADQRILDICKTVNATTYINMEGGKHLYSKPFFRKHGVDLQFLKPVLPHYNQYNHDFVGGLSILDVLMFNSADDVRKMLNEYSLGA